MCGPSKPPYGCLIGERVKQLSGLHSVSIRTKRECLLASSYFIYLATSAVHSSSLSTHSFLAVEALRRLLYGVYEECMRHLRSALECSVYPQRPATPYLRGINEERRVGNTVCVLEPGAVVGYSVRTLLMVVLVTTCQ